MWFRTLLLFLSAYAFCIGATAQTYRLQSLDGTPVQVQVRELSDSSRRALTLVCGKDTVFAYDYWAPKQVKVVNKRFLQVTYAVRGGSNLGVGNTLLLCIDKGHLRQAMKACTFIESDLRNAFYIPGNPDEYELFRARTQLVGTTAKTYQLHLTVHDEARSAQDPSTNHNDTKHVWLSFDPTHGVFYSATKELPPLFSAYDPKTERVISLKATEPVPVIALHNSTYYFINGEWYEEARNE